MRPVDRGAAPRNFTDYHQARDPLIAAIGGYCSYCEMPCQFKIEHVLPWENKHISLKLDWSNFLLTCDWCNLNKRSRQDATPYHDPITARARYLWPDQDNTARAFNYLPTNQITIATGLTISQVQLAKETQHMVGLDKLKPDPRVQMRSEAWKAAQIFAVDYFACPTPEKRELLVLAAKGHGFWSVWRTVFAADVDVLNALNQAFVGTDPASFDVTSAAPIARHGGQV